MPQLQIHDRLSSLCPRSGNDPEEGYYGSVRGVEMTFRGATALSSTRVRFWPLADINLCSANVRFRGQSGFKRQTQNSSHKLSVYSGKVHGNSGYGLSSGASADRIDALVRAAAELTTRTGRGDPRVRGL